MSNSQVEVTKHFVPYCVKAMHVFLAQTIEGAARAATSFERARLRFAVRNAFGSTDKGSEHAGEHFAQAVAATACTTLHAHG